MDTIGQILSSLTEGDASEALAETGRFLYVYNATTLIASLGAVIGLFILTVLLWIAVSTATKGHKYAGGGYDGYGGYGGYYRASRDIGTIASPCLQNEIDQFSFN